MRIASCLIAAALFAAPALAADAPAAGKYSTSTTQMGTLLADPAAKAVLEKIIPDLVKNPDMAERASGMTLREISDAIKTYSPDALGEPVLAKIDVELAKLPAKH